MINEEIIRQLKTGIASLKEISWAYLYGSILTRQDFEDVDIAVYLPAVLLKSDSSRLKPEQRLGADLEHALHPRREVDLKILNHTPISFQYKVIKNGKLIFFRDPAEVIRYEGDTASFYLDYKPTLQFFERDLLERIGKW